ncbi:MAG: KamA family radical SAM protein, partial [Rhizobacter sp.]|nr:KamA family radical SAM protein [Chlorobiales bacterium]
MQTSSQTLAQKPRRSRKRTERTGNDRTGIERTESNEKVFARTVPEAFTGDEDKVWKNLLANSIETPEEVHRIFGEDLEMMKKLEGEFNIRINPYYASLIKEKNDPIYKQVVPSADELIAGCCVDDPLNEERDSPVQSITHRYPDRVLFLVAHECAIYCRFCTRKRKVSDSSKISLKYLDDGINYIREHTEIRDIVLSGGDPLTLSDRRIEYILKSLREIPHVEVIRIGTKIPCVLPQRITKKLCSIIKKYHPVYVNTHFNHPRELTPEAKKACEMLADSGVPVGNQSVLLKGVNDDPQTMKTLMQGLLKMRVRPYYIYQADIVKGTEHFRTKVEKGLEIIQALRGHTSGLAVPHFVIDSPGGGGKIPLLPHYIQEMNSKEVVMKNY